jgi:hypothetical protein
MPLVQRSLADVAIHWPRPNYINPHTRGPELYIINSIFLLLATLGVVTRLYTRISIRNWFGLDDVFISVALVRILPPSVQSFVSFGSDRQLYMSLHYLLLPSLIDVMFAFLSFFLLKFSPYYITLTEQPTDAFYQIAAIGVYSCVFLGVHKYDWTRHIYDVPFNTFEGSGKALYASRILWSIASTSARFSVCSLYYRLLDHSGLRKYRWVLHVNSVFMVVFPPRI